MSFIVLESFIKCGLKTSPEKRLISHNRRNRTGLKDCSCSLAGLCMRLEGYDRIPVVLYEHLGVQDIEKEV